VKANEVSEGQRLSRFVLERLQSVRNLIRQIAQVCSNVGENVFAGNPVKLDAASRRKVRKVHFHFALDIEPALGEQGFQLSVNPITSV